jgi:hypothetical protein
MPPAPPPPPVPVNGVPQFDAYAVQLPGAPKKLVFAQLVAIANPALFVGLPIGEDTVERLEDTPGISPPLNMNFRILTPPIPTIIPPGTMVTHMKPPPGIGLIMIIKLGLLAGLSSALKSVLSSEQLEALGGIDAFNSQLESALNPPPLLAQIGERRLGRVGRYSIGERGTVTSPPPSTPQDPVEIVVDPPEEEGEAPRTRVRVGQYGSGLEEE